jgi:hypothetical protein
MLNFPAPGRQPYRKAAASVLNNPGPVSCELIDDDARKDQRYIPLSDERASE